MHRHLCRGEPTSKTSRSSRRLSRLESYLGRPPSPAKPVQVGERRVTALCRKADCRYCEILRVIGCNDPTSTREESMGERPAIIRPTDGRSHTPLLLKDERGRPSYDSPDGSARPPFHARRSTFRSRSPDMEGSSATRKKYTYAAMCLVLSLISFTVQTETAVHIQHVLGWNKAYCMM